MARPAIELDKQKFEALCQRHFKETEIAEIFGVDTDTVNNWCKRTYNSCFSAVSSQKKLEGNAMIINKALKLAERNGAVMIFLLKNWCGMSDNVELKADTTLMSALLDAVSSEHSIQPETT